jgi:hypothetical protein
MSLKPRIERLEQVKRRQSTPVLLWLNDDESEPEARQRAGIHSDDPVVIVRWMTESETCAHEHA